MGFLLKGIYPLRVATITAAAIFCAICLAATMPAQAYATYRTVREPESYAVSSNFAANGEVLQVSQIPDGEYKITAVTTSRMCRMYSSSSGAARGGGPDDGNPYSEKCTLVVKEGSGTAVFFMTKSYTRLYEGTAEQAAALTNEEGTYDSEDYIRPDASYENAYALSVSVLNSANTFASFNGNSTDFESAAWMNRQVIYHTSPEIYEAIESAKSAGSGSSKGGSGSGGGSGSSGTTPAADPNEDAGDYALPDSAAGGADNSTGAGSGTGSGTGSGAGQGSDADDDAKTRRQANAEAKGPNSAEDADAAASADGMRGVLIYPSTGALLDVSGAAAQVEPAEETESSGATPEERAFIAVVCAAVVGALWRAVGFIRDVRKARVVRA